MSATTLPMRKLSTEFTKDVSRDGVKSCVLPAKFFLEGICLWPDSETLLKNVVGWFWIVNLSIMEVFHARYVLKHFKNISDAVGAGATVSTTFSSIARVYYMLTRKRLINETLVKIWKQFWPLDAIEPMKRKEIKTKVQISLLISFVLLLFTTLTNTVITCAPYIRDRDMPLKSAFPFEWHRLYVYEFLYLWQYIFEWFVLFMINAFDFFFVSLVTICYLQFVILQEVVRLILTEESRKHRVIIFGKRGETMTDREMLFECLEQHKLIIGICNELESSFNIPILIQFFTSTCGICAATLIMKVDYSQFSKMFTLVGAHISQLFCYCYVGQHLAFESDYLSYAIYDCGWHIDYDRSFRKALILMMQRSQRTQRLTAAGITELDYASFLGILRLSFSFYTLLNNLFMKNVGQ
uniref:Odorant receptor n=1 Tax=Holotrichia parallela TaxID=93412 RepID=A0AA49X768_HOLPA|nr:odorant receptor 39a [Holotrichia parallela]